MTLAQTRRRLVSRVRSAFARPAAHFQPDPARDVFLVSYPRSGNTWMRTAIAILQTGEDVASIGDLDYVVPDSHQRVPGVRVRQLPRYVVKSHFQLRARLPSAKYRRVIYLVRDPRDCLVSQFRYFAHTRKEARSIDEFVIDSVAGRVWPCSWQEHVLGWTFRPALPANREMLTLRYEDVRADPATSLHRIARFLRLRATASAIDDVVAATTVERMREREAGGLRRRESSMEPYFIGPAHSGGWRPHLGEQSLDAIRRFAGPAMELFGYRWDDGESTSAGLGGFRPVPAHPRAIVLGDEEGVGGSA